ncbi:MAG TPA: Ig-like domain-containing protein, partial [Gemmatimonadales bacterium]|nr:Ig-like domain-containing protein [Gemmatimonadales bacterium]
MNRAHGSLAAWLTWALPVAAVLVGSCGEFTGPRGAPGWPFPEVSAVTVSPEDAVVPIGQPVALTVSVIDAAGRPMKRPAVTWSTSDSTIAQVSPSGVVTALAAGAPVTITATSGGRSGRARLTATDLKSATTSGVTYARGSATSGSGTSVSLLLSSTTSAGDLVVVGFDFPSVNFASISDNQGNTFTEVGTEIATPGGAKTRLYYARNIKGGSETVTVTLSGSSSYLEVYALEYQGADTANPLDVTAEGKGSSGSVTSGAAVTTTANDLVFGFCIGDNSCTAGSGFTARSTYNSNLAEDRVAATAGSNAATGSASGGWAMIMAAFKPQSPGAPVATVTVAPATGSVQVGATLPLAATTLDAAGNVLTGRTVTWSSSNTALATVSSTGVVTGVAAGGPVTITATSEGQSGTAAITVTPAPVATVTVTPATGNVYLGQTLALTAVTKDA